MEKNPGRECQGAARHAGGLTVGVRLVDASPSAAQDLMILHRSAAPLSGVTTSLVVPWLLVWLALDRAWRGRDVAMGRIAGVAFVFLAVALLLTVPPIANLFRGGGFAAHRRPIHLASRGSASISASIVRSGSGML